MLRDDGSYKSYAVLFVDDEEKTLKYFDKAFSADFRVITANSAAMAIDILDRKGDEIGVLITDQRMPSGSGASLLKYAREHHPLMVRMLTTAYSDLETAIEAINNGEIFRYITKPWDIRNLRGDLLRAMDYFHAIPERDLLLREKLSIWQRMVHLDRVRDLLVMAGALVKPRYALHAIDSYLRQVSFTDPAMLDEQAVLKQVVDPWQFMINEVRSSLAVGRQIGSMIDGQGSAGSFSDVLTPQALLGGIAVPMRIGLHGDASVMTASFRANGVLVRQMLVNVVRQFEDNAGIFVCSVPGDMLCFNVQGQLRAAEGKKVSSVDEELLAAFYICYHHAGKIHLDHVDPGRVRYQIFIPVNPSAAMLAPLPDEWVEEVFVNYENMG